MIDSSRPRARTDGISLAEMPDGLVILALPENQYHALDATTAAVWRLADGSRSVATIAHDTGLAPDAVALALADLAEVGLLVTGDTPRLDRRVLLVKLTAAGIAAPVISSITAASAAAQMTCTNPCMSVQCPGYDPCICIGPCARESCPGYNRCDCEGPCSSIDCPGFCTSNCNPCLCDPTGCACNPCNSPTCPGYDPCQCTGGQCNPACPGYDPCFCQGPCANPACPGYDPCMCGGIC